MMTACQGRDKTPTLKERRCPRCGHLIEIFSIDTEVECEHCGFKVYNDTLNCVQWCEYAKSCVGAEAYDQLMKVAAMQKERREAERAARMAEKEAQKATA